MARTRRKKHRTHVKPEASPGTTKNETPRSFVMKRGKLGELVKELTEDVRKVMEPLTARNLKESKQNKLKDFVQVCVAIFVQSFPARFIKWAFVVRRVHLTLSCAGGSRCCV